MRLVTTLLLEPVWFLYVTPARGINQNPVLASGRTLSRRLFLALTANAQRSLAASLPIPIAPDEGEVIRDGIGFGVHFPVAAAGRPRLRKEIRANLLFR